MDVRLGENGREIFPMRWGLVPFFWNKTLKEVPATFNARDETVHDKPMFRDSFKRRRCIIPASGSFEWTDEPDGKQPHFFSAADGSPILCFTSLSDRWRDPATGDEMLSFTMIVSGASEWMEPYRDHMPVLLAEKDFDGGFRGRQVARFFSRRRQASQSPCRPNFFGVHRRSCPAIRPR